MAKTKILMFFISCKRCFDHYVNISELATFITYNCLTKDNKHLDAIFRIYHVWIMIVKIEHRPKCIKMDKHIAIFDDLTDSYWVKAS